MDADESLPLLLHPVMAELIVLMKRPGWLSLFEDAVANIVSYQLDEFEGVYDLPDWISWANSLLTWVPTENHQGDEVDRRLIAFHFSLHQPSLARLQKGKVLPAWMVRYA